MIIRVTTATTATITEMKAIIEKFYYSPIFSEAKVENAGKMGVVYSGINLAVWSVAIGAIAHFTPARKYAVHIGIGVFAAAVAGEIIFGLSGPSNNPHTIQLNHFTNHAPLASTIVQPDEGLATATVIQTQRHVPGVAGYTEVENENYGATRNGFGNE